MSTQIRPYNKVLQFLGGFLAWFLVAGIGPILILLPPIGKYDYARLAYLLIYCGITFLLTISVPIVFIRRQKTPVAAGIASAVAVNVLVHALMSSGLTVLLWAVIPFFVMSFWLGI